MNGGGACACQHRAFPFSLVSAVGWLRQPISVFVCGLCGRHPHNPAHKHPCERRRREVGGEWERPADQQATYTTILKTCYNTSHE